MHATVRRRRALPAVLTGAVACGAALAPPALAVVPGAEPLGAAGSGVVTDGERYAAYPLPDGRLRVIDEGSGRASFEVAVPEHCPAHYPRMGVGGGQVVVLCRTPSQEGGYRADGAQRLDITTRAWSEVPGADSWTTHGILRVSGVGERWIATEEDSGAMRWIDWRTGASREDEGDARQVPDLDGDALFEPMCAPLRRPLPDDLLSAEAFMATAYEHPFALSRHVSYRLTVQRCGEPRATVVGTSIDDGQLGAGVASWRGSGFGPGPNTFAYLPACRLRLGWSLPVASQVAHTRGALYVTVFDTAPGGPRVERVPLPSGCPAGPPLRVDDVHGRTRVLRPSWWKGRAAYGGEVRRFPLRRPVAPSVLHARGALVMRTATHAKSVVWRRSDGMSGKATRSAGANGRSWRVPAPRRRGTTAIEVFVRDRAGGSARYGLHVERTAGRR